MAKMTIDDLDAPLPFPLKTVPASWGTVQVYEIPDDKKAEVLELLYPFIPLPSLDDEMEDIHAEKNFRVRDFIVAREGRMNVLASPFYPEAGGTVIDWWSLDDEGEEFDEDLDLDEDGESAGEREDAGEPADKGGGKSGGN